MCIVQLQHVSVESNGMPGSALGDGIRHCSATFDLHTTYVVVNYISYDDVQHAYMCTLEPRAFRSVVASNGIEELHLRPPSYSAGNHIFKAK